MKVYISHPEVLRFEEIFKYIIYHITMNYPIYFLYISFMFYHPIFSQLLIKF